MDFEGARKLEQQINERLPDDAFKGFEKQFGDMVEQATQSAYDYMRENIGYWYSMDIRQAANNAIEAILRGNVAIARQYLKLDGYTGRVDPGTDDDYKLRNAHPIINGELSESFCLEIRRKVAEAHPDLVRDERILDLENQVASLVAQVNKLIRERDEMRGADDE